MKKFLIRKIANDGDQQYNMSGPFVVRARNPLHAARLARHKWPHYLSNHIRVETNALAVSLYGDQMCKPFISDRRGSVIPSAARFH